MGYNYEQWRLSPDGDLRRKGLSITGLGSWKVSLAVPRFIRPRLLPDGWNPGRWSFLWAPVRENSEQKSSTLWAPDMGSASRWIQRWAELIWDRVSCTGSCPLPSPLNFYCSHTCCNAPFTPDAFWVPVSEVSKLLITMLSHSATISPAGFSITRTWGESHWITKFMGTD